MWQLIGYFVVMFIVGFYCGFNRGAVEGYKRAIMLMGMIGKAKREEKKEGENE